MANVERVTLKGFNNGAEFVGRGETIEVSEERAKELERNGLVAFAEETKAAQAPANKNGKPAENKGK
ncbi:MAG: hypothetical protein [Bacteriophage sp.]|nr:MAG: hypothetical protein [Bacteriophage sp.]